MDLKGMVSRLRGEQPLPHVGPPRCAVGEAELQRGNSGKPWVSFRSQAGWTARPLREGETLEQAKVNGPQASAPPAAPAVPALTAQECEEMGALLEARAAAEPAFAAELLAAVRAEAPDAADELARRIAARQNAPRPAPSPPPPAPTPAPPLSPAARAVLALETDRMRAHRLASGTPLPGTPQAAALKTRYEDEARRCVASYRGRPLPPADETPGARDGRETAQGMFAQRQRHRERGQASLRRYEPKGVNER